MITNYSYPSFKSKLPPDLPKSKNTTFDFWPEFKTYAKKKAKKKSYINFWTGLKEMGTITFWLLITNQKINTT